ncbi:MAG: hypothetical protein A3J72_07315 [Nitrospirae bacterium RIFCSPHIGHO2_02_FULL_40_19]|nr:MAG: hypothetical protein A3J72_07315 [Nitrospirae bacterium RIFCSPHIGHO2_02_FULL_40_19]
MGATKRAPKGEVIELKSLKSAPHYFEEVIPRQYLIATEKQTIEAYKNLPPQEVDFLIKMYFPDILIVEASVNLQDVFADNVISLRDQLVDECHKIFEKRRGKKETTEEYSIMVVGEYSGEPEQFFNMSDKIAGFLKSESLPLDKKEIESTLAHSIKYAKNDLVIVDWDGAFIFDPENDFASTIELLELANFQLLRYRILDSFFDERLRHVAEIVAKAGEKRAFLFGGREVRAALKSIIEIRATSLSEFLSLERDIKLIGDWYSARLYDMAGTKFKFSEWRGQIKDKLDALEDIYSIATERFSLSWERIELIGWFVLLLGWTILLIFDLYFAFYGKP